MGGGEIPLVIWNLSRKLQGDWTEPKRGHPPQIVKSMTLPPRNSMIERLGFGPGGLNITHGKAGKQQSVMTRMERLIANRIEERRAKALAAAERVLDLLRRHGVEARLVGSLARGDFDLASDVDFLVLTCPESLRYGLEAEVEEEMTGLPFDVLYLDEIESGKFREKLLREAGHASPQQPPSPLNAPHVSARHDRILSPISR